MNTENEIVASVMQLLKEAYRMQNTDENWEVLLKRAEIISARYKGTDFHEFAIEQCYSICERMLKVVEKRAC